MKKIFYYFNLFNTSFNTNLSSDEENKILKRFDSSFNGEFAELGNSLLYSSQLALDEIVIKMFLSQEMQGTTTRKT